MGYGSTTTVWEARTLKWREIAWAVKGGMTKGDAARKFEVSERTVYRILSRRGRGGEVRAARPPGPRPGEGPGRAAPKLVQLVCDFKRDYPERGHHYCYHFLKRLGHWPPSATAIWRIWRRHERLRGKRKRQSWRKRDELAKKAPGFFQMDTMYLPGDRFAFVAVDTFSRFGHVEIAHRRDARRACAFLRSLILAYPAKLTGIQTDNGCEFYGSFKKLVRELGLPHLFAWTNCPEKNGMVERFVRTVREESLLDAVEPESPTEELLEEAEAFLHHYNNERLHSRLDYRTPMEYLMKHLCNHQHHPST